MLAESQLDVPLVPATKVEFQVCLAEYCIVDPLLFDSIIVNWAKRETNTTDINIYAYNKTPHVFNNTNFHIHNQKDAEGWHH